MHFEIPARASAGIRAAVEQRWTSLTKPPGSLGRLETLVADVAEMQATATPSVAYKAIYIFCGDHGVTAEGVSAWPSEVTAQMVRNFVRGGAAISVLGKSLGASLHVVDCGVLGPTIAGTLDRKIAEGTCNFAQGPAMTRAQVEQAVNNGAALARETNADIVGIGEMGIGNTTPASALACAYAGLDVEEAVGRGAGISDEGLERKRTTIARALALHRDALRDPVDTLAALGGFEIATMAGFVLECGVQRRPVVVDGFIATAAVLAARAIAPQVTDYLLYAHCSAEHAHRKVLEYLGTEPLLELDLRLGEGSGAALALGIIDQAHALYARMATFEEASVAEAKEHAL
jgi:nicotinate-nucleotide--dimethylbenzimidazole phosphoribosyltransferase